MSNHSPKGSRFDYLLQQHYVSSRHNARCDANPISGLFLGKPCLQIQPHSRDQCSFSTGCFQCTCSTEIQHRSDSTQCTSLFFGLIEAVQFAESSEEHTYGFSVGAKANPGALDLPWVENVTPRIPSSGKLRLREKIVSVNGYSVAGLSAREVKRLVLESRLKLQLEVFGEAEDETRIRTEILCRGRLGFFHEFAEIWCRKVDNSSCEFDVKAVQAYKDIQSALHTFMSLLNGLDEADQLVNALGKKASISKGPSLRYFITSQDNANLSAHIVWLWTLFDAQITLFIGQV
jgi:hypothetical protein